VKVGVAADDASFDREVRAVRGALVVVYFWGPDCPNCDVFKAALPGILDELGEAPVRLVSVEAIGSPDTALAHSIYGVPTFYLYRDGEKLGRMSEFRGRRFFVDVLREHLPVTSAPCADPDDPAWG
jgi:thiol-disulfide isomerase/thioredoxin